MTTEIGFKADVKEVKDALDTIKIVKPPGVTDQGLAGYLFVVTKKVSRNADGSPGPNDGQDVCRIYSRDALCVARAEFPIRDVHGEGPFTYQVERTKAFEFAEGELEFKIRNDEENNTFGIQWGYGGSEGASTDEMTFDPRMLSTCDAQLSKAVFHNKYPTSILSAALAAAKPYLASEQDRNAKDEHKVVTLYDESSKGGNGTVYSTDGYQHFYFQCDALKGEKGLQVQRDHIALVEGFLAKCGPTVVIHAGTNEYYAMTPDESRVLSWSKQQKPPIDFKSIPKSWDKVVLKIQNRVQFLSQIKWMTSLMGKGYDKLCLKYDHTSSQMRMHLRSGGKAKSLPIPAEIVGEYTLPDVTFPDNTKGWEFDVNSDWLLRMFQEVKENIVEFRMFPMEQAKGAGFRTVDEFILGPDGKTVGGSNAIPDPANGFFQCKVTRFMSSKH